MNWYMSKTEFNQTVYPVWLNSVFDMYQFSVVYTVNCEECESTYIGETKRTLDTRLKEHKRAVITDDSHSCQHRRTQHKLEQC